MIWTDAVWLAFQMPSTWESPNDCVGAQSVPGVTEPTVVSFVAPPSRLQRSETLSTPQVPLVRFAKKRNERCAELTQKVGETTRPVALIASDFASVAALTL